MQTDADFWAQLADDDRPRLLRTDHNRTEKLAEMRLLAQLSQLMHHRLPQFIDAMQTWLNTTTMGNHVRFEVCYVLWTNGDEVQVWHCNANRDWDRHVCTITKRPDHD